MLTGCEPWPEEIARSYREAGYWAGQTLGEALRGWAARGGDRTAVVSRDRRVSYRELDEWVDRLAAGFHAREIGAGDRVVVQLPNTPEFIAVCFALFRLGAVPVFALPAHRASEITHLCRLTDAVAYLVPALHRGYDHRLLARQVRLAVPGVRQVFVAGEPGEFVALADVDAAGTALPAASGGLAEPDPADVAFFLLSGGTTALPKLVPRTHDDFLYQARAASAVCGLNQDSVYLAALPAAFNFAWGCPGVLGTLHAGGTVVLARSASPDECFTLIERERVTITSVVPTVAQLWLDAVEWNRRDLSSLRVLQIGGAKLHRELAERVQPALGCRLQQVLGMAEGLICFTREDYSAEEVLTTQGHPLSPADEIRVVDEHGRDAPDGELGELLTRGPYTIRGYYRAPEHNATAFTEDGFYRTGDLVRRTAAGRIVVDGRIKDLVNRCGEKVSASEVEGHLLAHPRVAQAAVVPAPHPELGEQICAFVVPSGEAPSLVELRRLLLDRGLAAYKLPDRLDVVVALPVTGLGKVDKKVLAADALRRVEADQTTDAARPVH
ncbi:(2,3-dihydroxybenzoyl)adenylate synthase [Goodfellowiella coeruleoviolacea]|uniref:2,3-dihydroxybenzoate-AMP ligase n=1 Tax=Goodfellowiella coeruleoviolacea TaxID=334858 RepID=A0AAE3GAN9_9PSEU|nr:AMP-binding protein [Goodfellowiella coeruleoviolacea]MCP2163944.1 2,3-dihydroxybenzoate-AMP ligase [Goodfellowiella coeruleoviolacea]